MNSDRFEQLVAGNAQSARQLWGPPTLAVPSPSDPGFFLRTKVMQRSLYPLSAPPPTVVKNPVSAGHSVKDSTSTLVSVTTSNTAPRSGTIPAHPSSTSVSLLNRPKRSRDDGGVDAGKMEASPIISVDPQQLKNRHALVIAAAAQDAVADGTANAGYTPPPTWKMFKVLVGHQGWVWSAAVDPTNSWFATGGFDGIIKIWDLTSGALKLNMTGHKEAVRGIALSAISPYMFSGSDDHSIKCWDLERNEVIREFFGHRSAVHSVTVHPALNVVVSGGRDKTVRVWDVRSRSCVHTLAGHTDSVMCVVSQQTEPQIISGGSDGMIYFWDMGSGKPITRLTRHKKPVRGLAITPSGSQLVSCGADEIRMWKLPNGEFECNASTIVNREKAGNATRAGEQAQRPGEEEELAYRWSCCAISPRNVLAVGSQDGHLGFFDGNRPQSRIVRATYYSPYQMTRTKSMPGTIAGEGGINCVVYDASGTRMITAESDKSVKMWRLRSE